jgi:hypothetical protein
MNLIASLKINTLNPYIAQKLKNLTYFTILITLFSSCAAPRAITNSGKVTPHKQLRFGSNFSGNISSYTATSLFDGAISTATDLAGKDTVNLDESVYTSEKVGLSYALDPIGAGYDFYVRYGIFKKVDIGYKFASGVHVFDAMYQFMGSTGTIDNPGKKGMSGSIGIQYSSQSYDLPFGFSKIQSLVGLEFKRKDLLIPLIFSVPFGEEEKYGCLSFGAAYNHSFINYGFDPDNIYIRAINSTNLVKIDPIQEKQNYSSLGLFFNLKAGYKYVYVLASLSMYYQDYGTYHMLNGESLNMSSYTFIPTLGLQFNVFKIPFLNKKENKSK